MNLTSIPLAAGMLLVDADSAQSALRWGAGIIAVVLIVIIILRRKKKKADSEDDF